jgi:GDP-mannose 6-dehydrogenase
VGTPSNGNGSPGLQSVVEVCRSIAQALRRKQEYHLIVLRSTVAPGTMNRLILPLLERESGKKLCNGFGLCYNPVFLREGSAVKDFYSPPFTLIGARDRAIAEKVLALYEGIEAPVYLTHIEVAEAIKYASNIFHALKIIFANEIGAYCKALGIDSHQVMEIFSEDTKLNISTAYLKPGFAFGGSCLEKDLRAFLHEAKMHDLHLPVLESILPSNRLQVQRAVDLVVSQHKKKVGILGLSFKAGTDDLRDSPLVVLAETLLGKGYKIRIYDRNVSLGRLAGANKDYVEKEIPHLSRLLSKSPDDVINFSEILIIGNQAPEFAQILNKRRPEQIVIDLVRVLPDNGASQPNYVGICW